ncbi:MAG: hypothetical protein WCC36_12640 [Gammaproteobacteria bacterium]
MATEATGGRHFERLVLALDSSGEDGQRLHAAARLAARLDLELSGLFVEDIALHRLAGLPIASEVSLLAAQTRAFAAAQLERGLRRQAARLEAALRAAAQAVGVPCSFQALCGQPIRGVLTAATAGDLVLVAASARYRSGGPPRVPGPVMVVFDGASVGTQVLTLAGRLARLDGRRLQVLLVGTESQTVRLREQAQGELASTMGTQVNYAGIGSGAWPDVLDAASRLGAELLVTDLQRMAAADPRTLQHSACTIVVVR